MGNHELSDILFLRNINNIYDRSFEEFEQIVIVNQFYFTKLEKALVNKLPKEKTIIYLQLPEEGYDKDRLSVKKNISLIDSRNMRTKRIEINQSSEIFALTEQLFSDLEHNGCRTIIDFDFYNQPYAEIFSPEKFDLSDKTAFNQSSVFIFLQSVFDILKSMIVISRGKYLIDIIALQNALFSGKFSGNFENENRKFESDSMLEYLGKLLDNDFVYMDLAGKCLNIYEPNPILKDNFKVLFDFINRFVNISGLDELVDLMSDERFINPRKIFSEKELHYSDAEEIFYRSLADFSTLKNFFSEKILNSCFPISKNRNAKLMNLCA